MKRLRLSLYKAFSALPLVLLVSCGNQSVRPAMAPPSFPDATVEEKIDRLRLAPVVEAAGTIEVRGISLNRSGNFSLVVKGDELSLEVYSSGIRIARVELVAGSVRMIPHLRDEYLEHMFAVVLRDSILWWDMQGYETVEYERKVLLRNSWRKLYINLLTRSPERQIFRLTGMKTVEVFYSDDRQFAAGFLPSGILFVFDAYECVLHFESVSLTTDVREHTVQGQLPQF